MSMTRPNPERSPETANQISEGTAVDGVSVIVPCYNEGATIHHLADRLSEFLYDLPDHYRPIEFIFVDDGSTDRTWELLADHFSGWTGSLLIRHEENTGVMGAIMTGIRAATYDTVCSIDSDCTYDPNQLTSLIDQMDDGVALVTASPYHPLGQVLNVPRWRIWLSYTASRMYQMVMPVQLYCYTSCFRVYRKSAVLDLKLEEAGFIGTAELLWRICDAKAGEIREVPAVLGVREYGQSKFRTVQVSLGHLGLMKTILGQRVFGSSKFRSPKPYVPTAVEQVHL